jgi:hypothetical protein
VFMTRRVVVGDDLQFANVDVRVAGSYVNAATNSRSNCLPVASAELQARISEHRQSLGVSGPVPKLQPEAETDLQNIRSHAPSFCNG